MYWSALAEILHGVVRPSPFGAFSPTGGRVLMYVGATTFFLYPRY
jgi:hypothetical protein